ncbi:EpsG family protein [Eubacteriaceae bacterium ES2]|nr:EpsG family protein [Eubacteriaceae bacterium ES2]
MDGEHLYLLVMFVFFTTIMALRSPEVGVDTSPYTRIFEIIRDADSLIVAFNIAPLTAPIYVLLCRSLAVISQNPQIMIVFSAFFINIGVFIYINKVSHNVVLSTYCWIGLTLFYCSMNGTRQCMAVVLVLNALYYLADNIKNLRGWIMIFLAIGIHLTSLIALIAVIGFIIEDKFRDKKIVFLISVFITIVCSLSLNGIIILFLKFFPSYSMYGTGELSYSIFKSTGGGRIIYLYIFLFLICILWIIKKSTADNFSDRFHYRMIPALIFGLVFGMINCKNILISRMLWFFLAFFISFIPSTVESYNGKVKIILHVFVIAILGAYSILSLIENQNGIVPYSLFWN